MDHLNFENCNQPLIRDQKILEEKLHKKSRFLKKNVIRSVNGVISVVCQNKLSQKCVMEKCYDIIPFFFLDVRFSKITQNGRRPKIFEMSKNNTEIALKKSDLRKNKIIRTAEGGNFLKIIKT